MKAIKKNYLTKKNKAMQINGLRIKNRFNVLLYKINCYICINLYAMKTCFKCKETLEENMFYDKHRYCKNCHKETVRKYQDKNKERVLSNGRIYNIKKRYGITQEQYNEMFIEQNGKCAICGSSEIKRENSKHFCIDHCHKTNKVRGLLCHDCNVVLGKLKDSIDMCKSIINYLEK